MSARAVGPWIALAGVAIGAGLYFGLRRPSQPPPSAAPLVAAAPDATAAARAAFEPLRLQWRATCWEPLARSQPSVHLVEVSFDARGREILRAINDDRRRTRGDVAECLRAQPTTPLAIPPTGSVVTARFELAFP